MTVQQWLDDGQDYEVGRQLYAALGDNERLKRTFSSGPSLYNLEALKWEITKLARVGAGAIVPVNVTALPAAEMPKEVQNATETLRSAATDPDLSASLIPAEAPLLIELAQARRPLYDERTLLHGQLELLAEKGTQEEVRLAAERIMALSRQLDANWKLDAYVRKHGHLPPPPPAAPGLDALTPLELLTRRNTLRTRVSKLKKQPHRADDLVLVEAELKQVEILLNPAK